MRGSLYLLLIFFFVACQSKDSGTKDTNTLSPDIPALHTNALRWTPDPQHRVRYKDDGPLAILYMEKDSVLLFVTSSMTYIHGFKNGKNIFSHDMEFYKKQYEMEMVKYIEERHVRVECMYNGERPVLTLRGETLEILDNIYISMAKRHCPALLMDVDPRTLKIKRKEWIYPCDTLCQDVDPSGGIPYYDATSLNGFPTSDGRLYIKDNNYCYYSTRPAEYLDAKSGKAYQLTFNQHGLDRSVRRDDGARIDFKDSVGLCAIVNNKVYYENKSWSKALNPFFLYRYDFNTNKKDSILFYDQSEEFGPARLTMIGEDIILIEYGSAIYGDQCIEVCRWKDDKLIPLMDSTHQNLLFSNYVPSIATPGAH